MQRVQNENWKLTFRDCKAIRLSGTWYAASFLARLSISCLSMLILMISVIVECDVVFRFYRARALPFLNTEVDTTILVQRYDRYNILHDVLNHLRFSSLKLQFLQYRIHVSPRGCPLNCLLTNFGVHNLKCLIRMFCRPLDVSKRIQSLGSKWDHSSPLEALSPWAFQSAAFAK